MITVETAGAPVLARDLRCGCEWRSGASAIAPRLVANTPLIGIFEK